MKQLFIDDKATAIFFNDNVKFDDIFEYIKAVVTFDMTNLFLLNEQFSCTVKSIEGEIIISGDEDMNVIKVETLIPIK